CKAVSPLRSATAVQNAREVRQVLECGSPLLLNFECNSGATGFYFEAMRTRIVGRVPRPVALPPGVAFMCLLALSLSLVAAPYTPRRTGNFDFPVYTNNPSGKQLTGVYAPPSTPALAPEESQTKFHVPKGFEVRLFASEPEVVNPVAMTWDERGRLWVLELYEYPKGAPKGQKGSDRIKILEATDADGKADQGTVFAARFM